MFRVLVVIITVATGLATCSLATVLEVENQEASTESLDSDSEVVAASNRLIQLENDLTLQLEKLETLSNLTKVLLEKGTSKEVTHKVFSQMAEIISHINNTVKDKEGADVFIDMGGLDKVVFPYLKKPSKIIRNQVIQLLHSLLSISPKKTKESSSADATVDLLYMLKHDKYKPNKAILVDVFSKWLPENPKSQKDLLDNNGLEAFYSILPSIGIQLKVMLVNLLGDLISEQFKASNLQELTDLYEEVGLLDILKQRDTCEGLFYLFIDLFSSAPEDLPAIRSMSVLMEKILPYCKDNFKVYPKMGNFLGEMERFYNQNNNVVEKPAQEALEILKVIEKFRMAFAEVVKVDISEEVNKDLTEDEKDLGKSIKEENTDYINPNLAQDIKGDLPSDIKQNMKKYVIVPKYEYLRDDIGEDVIEVTPTVTDDDMKEDFSEGNEDKDSKVFKDEL